MHADPSSAPSPPPAEDAASVPLARRAVIIFERWWMVAVLLALYVLSGVDRMIIMMLVHPIQQDLGISDFGMSLILGPAFGVFYAVFGLPLGWAADRFPRRSVIALGASLWSLATAACGLANSFAHLLVLRMTVGVGEASLSPAAYSLIADKFPPHRLGSALAVFGMGPKLGKAAGYSIGALAIALATKIGVTQVPFLGEIQPWQLVFMVVGLPGLLMALLLYTFREPVRGAHAKPKRQAGAGAKEFIQQNKKMMVLMAVGFASVTLVSGASEWVPTLMSRKYGLEPIQYAPMLSLLSLIGAWGMLVKGAVIDWLYARGIKDAPVRLYTWLLVPAAVGTTVSYLAPSVWIFYAFYTVVQTVALGVTLYMSAIVQLIAPTRLRAQVGAFFLMMITVGASLGAPIAAALTDFVFRNPADLDKSLAIVATSGIVIAFVALRWSLRPMRPFIEDQDEFVAKSGS